MATDAEVENLKSKGNAAFSAGNHQEAVEAFSKAIELDPSNHILYSNRSATYASLKKWDLALEDAQTTVRQSPEWSKGYGRLGAALLGLGKCQEAKEAYEKGIELEPTSAQLKRGLELASEHLGRDGDRDRDGFPRESNPFSDPNVFAKLAANPAVSKYLADPEFAKKIAQIQRDPKNFGQYLDDPRMVHVLAAMMGVDVKTSEDFVPSAEKEKKAEPVLTDEQKKALEERELGNEAYKKRDFVSAQSRYEAALALEPTNVSLLTNKAAVLFETERYDECIAVCEQAVELGREHHADFKIIAKALGRIGSAYVRKDDLPSAIKYFNKSLTEHRTLDILEKLKEAERLQEQRTKAAYHSPEIAEQERSAGNELFKQGSYADAIQHYTEAIKRDEGDPRAYANRAACYLKLAAVPEGLKDCARCLELDPTFVKAYIRKAALEFLKRDYAAALETCQKALDCDRDGKHRSEIEQQMARCYVEIRRQGSGPDEETMQRAMANPEVREILSDPAMRQILKQMEADPSAAAEHLRNPAVAANIRKLVAAGIVKAG